MSEMKRPQEGEIWTGPGGVRFEVLVNAEHFVTADPLVVYRERRDRDGSEKPPAYVCTLEAFLEFMRPTGERVTASAAAGASGTANAAETANAAGTAKASETAAAQPAARELTPEQAAFRESVFHRGAAREAAAEAQEADPAFSEEEFMKAFFAAAGPEEQITIINENWRNITDRIVDNISIVLDLSIRSGSIDDRLIDLTGCLRMRSRFEGKRDRLRGE